MRSLNPLVVLYFLCLASLVAVVLMFTFLMFTRSERPKLEAWNTYKGELAAYNVVIDESMRAGIWQRLIHLEPIKGYEEPTPIPFALTGHDNDGDGQFDRIFIRERSIDGYNSVTFAGNGKRIWEPCHGDKDKVEPFTDEQVSSAQAQLYLAMTKFRNQDHVINMLERR